MREDVEEEYQSDGDEDEENLGYNMMIMTFSFG